MNGGVGPNSYVQNSAYQGMVLNAVKSIITEEIIKKLDVEQLCVSSANNPFCIADFGCATGDNSFAAIQMIIEATEKKLLRHNSENKIPEFHVFFNDRVVNDFNTLFNSLPAVRKYHAAGVPGTFYSRVLPKNSIHIAYSAWSLHWLSRVPEASMMEMDHTNMNKWKGQLRDDGNISYFSYSQQFSKDFELFLQCRAEELVVGGMMALLFPGVPNTMNPETDFGNPHILSLLGSCVMDMANEGRVSEAKAKLFNFPNYFPTPQEAEAIIARSPSFDIERIEILKDTGRRASPTAKAYATVVRSVLEGLFTSAFGTEINVDDLFDRFANKMDSPFFLDPDHCKDIIILAVLKRKAQ